MATMHRADVRQISPGIRRLTWFISGLAFVVAPLLYLLPDSTERLFAWTINPPITAAFLGGGYGTALAIEWLSARERVWAWARIVYPAMLLFTSLTLLATLLHLDKFHYNATAPLAVTTAWLWTVISVVAPPLMLFLLVYQLRAPGGEPPQQHPIAGWFRVLTGGQAATMMGLGAALFLAPDATRGLWPWLLTPLTAQAVGAWLLGLGFALGYATWEGDWARTQIAMIGNVVAGGLQLVTLLRFAGTLDWNRANTWIYAAFLVAIILIGGYGWWAARQSMQHPSTSVPLPV